MMDRVEKQKIGGDERWTALCIKRSIHRIDRPSNRHFHLGPDRIGLSYEIPISDSSLRVGMFENESWFRTGPTKYIDSPRFVSNRAASRPSVRPSAQQFYYS